MRRFGHVLSLSLAVLVPLAVLAAAAPARAQRPVPVNISSTPPGAQIFLDAPTGQPLGPTPQRAIRVPSGSHVLWFRLDGYADTQLPVNVHRRRETFNAILNALARMNISAGSDESNGAAVRIDGQPVGNVPYQGTVQPGRHLVQIGREGYVTFNQWADLTGGQVLTLPVTLQREAPSTGSVLVAADVSGAPIFVDSQPQGATPMVIEGLSAGAHVIGINHRDLRTFQVDPALTEQLVPKTPAGTIIVAGSGIQTAQDVKRMQSLGVHALLIGEALMTAPDPAEKIRELFCGIW